MAASAVVDNPQAVENRASKCDPAFPVEQLDFILPQNDSIIALSQKSPIEPIDGTSPERLTRFVKAQKVNCAPWAEWIISPHWGSRLAMAMLSASVTSAAV